MASVECIRSCSLAFSRLFCTCSGPRSGSLVTSLVDETFRSTDKKMRHRLQKDNKVTKNGHVSVVGHGIVRTVDFPLSTVTNDAVSLPSGLPKLSRSVNLECSVVVHTKVTLLKGSRQERWQ